MKRTLSFPTPPSATGAAEDFSSLKTLDDDNLPIPAFDITPQDSRPYARGLVRVLRDDNTPHGPWAEYLGDVDEAQLQKGLRDMMMMREIDRRMFTAQRQGKVSFYIQCTGEEAIGVGFQNMLEKGDMNFPTYRQQSLLIAAGYPLQDLFGQYYSNTLDPLEGRQLPVLHSSRDYGYFTVSGNLGTQYVQAVGWAMANVMTDTDGIAAAWIGDGATASNDFYTAMLTAAIYKPPVILNIVNNRWAISSHVGLALGGNLTFAQRAIGLGIPAIRVDGNDYLAVLAATKWAREKTNRGHGPVAIEWLTYRRAAHSTSDDPTAYREKNEAADWPFGDPIERLSAHLTTLGNWSPARFEQTSAELSDRVREVQKRVEAEGTLLNPTRLSPAKMFDKVYAEMPPHLKRQRQSAGY